ncbi:MAG: cytochrome c, partial [Planctomycetes bacterium]|nr:cytochrome c [Planctomycetota bacterium]
HGGERRSGIPYSIWQALPRLFPEKFAAGSGAAATAAAADYSSFGLIYEPGADLPIGVSKRRVQGIDRVFVNCAVCHVGTVRDTPESAPRIVLGMPANALRLAEFETMLFDAAADERFSPPILMAEIEAMGHEDWLNRVLLRWFGIGLMRDRLLTLRQRFSFMQRQPAWGPGRVDTFNSPKALLNFPLDRIPEREWIGTCDLPSIWLQRAREGMQLHWDGNNSSLRERNLSASFGTGVFPPSLDREQLGRIEQWLLDLEPPAWPYALDTELAARGRPIYERLCADCHGRSGRDFTGARVGKVTPIAEIGTDRWRLDSYSHRLAQCQNTLYAGYDERFRHFRKTHGYANQPLDGIWLRAPYLHNGSVPTLRDLLEPATARPSAFYRGNDLYDRERVGFDSERATETVAGRDGRSVVRTYFRFDTALPGNGNGGHDGAAYGTELAPAEKDALVEYLKTF